MGITDLSSFTSKQGVTTAVWRYDEAETFVVQHDFMHLSFFRDDFKEFVDTLVVALRLIEKAESPIRHIHPVAVREGDLSREGLADFGLGESDLVDFAPELPAAPVLTEVGDRG
ncbi:MAG: hypothetical protein ACYC99_15775 [Candidatus Geothermincolia bacterium]